MQRRVAQRLTLAGSVIVTLGLLWFTEIPLGIPGEWTWPRLPADAQTGWNLLLASLGGAIYLAFIRGGAARLGCPTVSQAETAAWVGLLGVASLAWLGLVQETAPPAGQFAKAPFVLYYPSSSGYFYKVRYEAPEVGTFLANYEQLMAEGDVLHVGTHPPGLFLLFHGLRSGQQTLPGAARLLSAWAPASFQEAMDIVRENTAATEHPAHVEDAVTLWLACLLAWCCAAATVWPLYGLLRLNLSAEAAWWGAALWPLVPALAIFLPKSDAAYPLLAATFVLSAVWSWRQKSTSIALFSGGLLFGCLMLSLAFLPVLLAVGLWVLWDAGTQAWQQRESRLDTVRWTCWWSLGLGVGFLLPIVALLPTGVFMPRVWLWNYANHAGFYAEYARTWWKWLLVNPVELALSVGAPVAVTGLFGLVGLRDRPAVSSRLRSGLCVGGAVWGLLWLSGKNSGEAARLWLLFMPGVVWWAGQSLARANSGDATRRANLILLALQLAVCILTVHRVGGFHLAGQ